MPEDLYIIILTALLPLTACLLVIQVNPYQALVIRGILGAVAALVYVLFGAADVALTEALVGTMLSITLYAVAVRSSMSMRVGVLENDWDIMTTPSNSSEQLSPHTATLTTLKNLLSKHHMRLETVTYADPKALNAALTNKEIHTALKISGDDQTDAHLQTRVRRLYEILQTELAVSLIEDCTAASHSSPQPKISAEGQL